MSLSLHSRSDNEILSRTQALTAQERGSTLLLLLHLSEIERRRLHLKLGYQSMFDYCTAGLKYSASAAMRRIRTARCIVRFPAVYGLLESTEVNLSTISQVSRVLTAENQNDVLRRIRGKSQREVEAIVAEYEPRSAMPPDRVRTVVMRVPVASRPSCHTAPPADHNRNGCEPVGTAVAAHAATCDQDTRSSDGTVHPPAAATARLERRALIQFTAGEAFMGKLEQARTLIWHRLPPNPSMEQVLELALDLLIEMKNPVAREKRRSARGPVATPEAALQQQQWPGSKHGSRHVPASVRDRVFVRDKGQCTYVGSTGRRCASRYALQVDHATPVARGGPGTINNLRILCAYHNRLEAARIMGGGRRPRDGSSLP